MKKFRIVVALILVVSVMVGLGACKNNGNNGNNYNAKVIDKGMDCGDAYLIQLYSNNTNIPENSTNNIFYAVNLPEQYQVKDLEIQVVFRIPSDAELLNCSTQDIAYPQIYIEQVSAD